MVAKIARLICCPDGCQGMEHGRCHARPELVEDTIATMFDATGVGDVT
jgi:hypothetical protein